MLSSRSSFDLSPNPLARALGRVRARGTPLLDLTESNPTRAGLPYDERAVLSAISRPPSLTYEPSAFGLTSARQAVARELSAYGPAVDACRVVLTASTSEAYSFLFKLLCDPGDEVLVPRPSYPLLEHLARLETVRLQSYRIAYDGSWHIDLPSLREAISPRTRAIVVVSPNNPTGHYLKRSELDALTSLGIPVVSDEVFAGYPLRDDATRVATALEAGDLPAVFVLGGLSKLAALPQMKLAWIAVGGTLLQTPLASDVLGRLEVIADAFLSVGTPVQHGVPDLLASRAAVQSALVARLCANRDAIHRATVGSAATMLDLEGGWYATLRLPATRSEEDWALAFLEDDGVYVHPGHFFDFEDESYVIISLLTIEAKLREGIEKIVERVRVAS